MSAFTIGSRCRIKQTVHENSPDPDDRLVRGQIVTLEYRMSCGWWEVSGDGLPDGYAYFFEEELEPVD